jgi:phospholipid/cholesterol/gamma-HCH transport system substrate-binding protein
VLVVAAVAVVAVTLFGGGSSYRVKARFQNASQLVKGDQVQVAGLPVGSVESIDLAPDGEAEVTLRIDNDSYVPLRRGTQIVARQASLIGVANRYLELQLPGGQRSAIPNGGTIPATSTVSSVDLDQLFNTLDPKTRAAASAFIRGSARQWHGSAKEANAGLLFLNPAVASTTRLMSVVGRDRSSLERMLTSSASLASDVAAKRDDLAALVDNLATTMSAVGSHGSRLSDAIEQLPPAMRQANTTLVDLRTTLDDLQPLVDDAKPAARALGPLSAEVQGFSAGARPTLRDLAALVSRAGTQNDLTDALRLAPPVRDAATRPVDANGAQRPPTFTSLTDLMRSATPEFAFLRPYSADLTGWFDDFAHSGVYDALGGSGRVSTHAVGYENVGGKLTYVPPDLRKAVFDRVASRDQRNRCPGSMERGTAWKPYPGFNCDLSQVPPGP